MLSLKRGVKVGGLKPETVLAISISHSIYLKHSYELTVTSIMDGKHSKNSLHYNGYAFDLRTNNLKGNDATLITNELSEALGDDYDVVLEKDHIHVEYDPA
jgi:hypothetical protein